MLSHVLRFACPTHTYLGDINVLRHNATPCMTIRGLQRLLMILGGKVAAEYREIVEGVFTRYMAGDTSLIEEVRANAASDAPENVSKQCL